MCKYVEYKCKEFLKCISKMEIRKKGSVGVIYYILTLEFDLNFLSFYLLMVHAH